MRITILMDNPSSWYNMFAIELKEKLLKCNKVTIVNNHEEILKGDIAFFLSCEAIIPKKILLRNKNNIVVHSSDLPDGKGWSPLTWQILQGKNSIVNTLFEATNKVDSGIIYMQNIIEFEGHELLNELHEIQGHAINKLIIDFIDKCPSILSYGKVQSGKETFYKKRSPKNSQLDPNKTLADQFNLLRVVDNSKYPAYFYWKGGKYILKITKSS